MNKAHSFPHLMMPVRLGAIDLKNRIIMGSMHTGLEERPGGMQRLAEFYRQRSSCGLIVTGGIAPNEAGAIVAGGARLSSPAEASQHRHITDAVHEANGRIVLQILHSGRYAFNPRSVAPSAIQSPITPFAPKAMTEQEIFDTIDDFGHCAALALEAGYDGVEVMGSEGYLLNQFTAPRTNQRDDPWGGDATRRMRFPLQVAEKIRAVMGNRGILMYRLSILDLVEDGSTFDEICTMAQRLEETGTDVINTGIGWHEARIPTIAAMVPPGGFSWVTRQLKLHVTIPVVASNRINDAALAESILRNKDADLVSMARPLLADAQLAAKIEYNAQDRINTCIACNQACLDFTFSGKATSCLVNPGAGRESIDIVQRAHRPLRLAVVGGGPAGMSCAATAAAAGHEVVLYESANQLGGQFLMAMRVPGKSVYGEVARYYHQELKRLGCRVKLNHRVTGNDLIDRFDRVVLATGVNPRLPDMEGLDHPSVVDYPGVFNNRVEIGAKVLILGGGGIGIDMAHYLAYDPSYQQESVENFLSEWGIDPTLKARGGIAGIRPVYPPNPRDITILQRSSGKIGAHLGKTTAWIHRAMLKHRKVRILDGITYQRIDHDGLHILDQGKSRVLGADHIILCTGQKPENSLLPVLQHQHVPTDLIGGADNAHQLNAQKAMQEGWQYAMAL